MSQLSDLAKLIEEARGQVNGNKEPGYIAIADAMSAIVAYMQDVEAAAIPFTVYTAKLNQPVAAATSGSLVIGKTYVIFQLITGDIDSDDFTNVGYVAESTPFLASGTTPTVWTEGTAVYCIDDIEAAIADIVFEDTLGETMTFTFVPTGPLPMYLLTVSNGIFLEDKTFIPINEDRVIRASDTEIDIAPNGSLGVIDNLAVEIRVYS